MHDFVVALVFVAMIALPCAVASFAGTSEA
jgi:hypothetical protein